MSGLYFPRTDAIEATVAPRALAEAHGKGSETILLVEDDAAVRHVAHASLTRAGYTVIECTNGVSRRWCSVRR